MTQRADFYILNGASLNQRDVYACRLIEKAFLAGMSVAVLVDEPSARGLDDLLWTFNDRSFVPHRLCTPTAGADPETPVHLHPLASAADSAADLVLNLSARMPAALETLVRVAVVIDEDPERRRIGREHFKAFRERNFELQTHRIDSFD